LGLLRGGTSDSRILIRTAFVDPCCDAFPNSD